MKKGLRPDLNYMTVFEINQFKQLKKSGHISFFRVSICEICGIEIQKNKRFCSITCKESYDSLPIEIKVKNILRRRK